MSWDRQAGHLNTAIARSFETSLDVVHIPAGGGAEPVEGLDWGTTPADLSETGEEYIFAAAPLVNFQTRPANDGGHLRIGDDRYLIMSVKEDRNGFIRMALQPRPQ